MKECFYAVFLCRGSLISHLNWVSLCWVSFCLVSFCLVSWHQCWNQAWARLSFWLIPSCSNEQNEIFKIYRSRSISSRSIKKYRSHSFNKKSRSMTGPDRWWKRSIIQSHLSHKCCSISFIPLNLIYTDEISVKLIQKLKNKHTWFSLNTSFNEN